MKELAGEKPALFRKTDVVLGIYLAGFLAALLSLSIVQPMEMTPPLYCNPPDEHARFLIPRFICENGTLPTGFEPEVRVPGGLDGSYAFQPILPYIIMGYLMRLFASFSASGETLLLVARFVNVLSGVLMAVAVYFLAKRIFSKPVWQYVFSFGVMYLPQHLFLHSYVNTESMCMLSIALLLLALVSLYQDGPGKKNHVLLAVGASLLVQTYYNAYGYLVTALLLYVLYYAEKKEDGRIRFAWQSFFRNGLPVLLFVVISSGWWFVREAVLLDGDFTGIKTNNEIRTRVVSPASQGIGLLELFSTHPVIKSLVRSAIALYGSMSIHASDLYYRTYELYLGAGLLCSLGGLRFIKRTDRRRLLFHAAVLLAVLITTALWVYYVYRIDYQAQGRYVLPALIPVCYYVCSGYERLVSHVKLKYAEAVCGTALVLFVTVALYHYIFKLCFPVYFMP